MKKKILLFGPKTPPYNGQAVAFTIVLESLSDEDTILVNTAKYNSKIINTLYSFLKTIQVFILCDFSTIYFTSSRSNFGFLKDFLLLFLGRLTEKRIINHLHGADFRKFHKNSRFLKPFIKYAYCGIHTSIVLVEGMKEEYKCFPKMKTEVVGNCFSKELTKKNSQIKKNLQILYLSNIMKSKGIIEFIDACDSLLAENSFVTVKIAGLPLADDFSDKQSIFSEFRIKYEQLKNQYGNRIDYLGSVSGEEKFKLLFESSIFVLPTYYPTEAFPISILEAMRAGNAIITTNHNYLPDIVRPRNGVVIEPKSSEEIIKAVEYLFEDEERLHEIQEHNILEAKEKYSQDRYVREVQSIIFEN